MKHTLIILHILCLLLLCACDKDQDPYKNAKLPAATQSGKNTVGFTLEDGQVWVPFYECALFTDPCGKYSARVSHPFADGKGIGLQFMRSINERSSRLSVSSAHVGTVTSTGEKIDSLGFEFRSEDNQYYGFPLFGSRFTVTKFDKANQIIAGEFHLILKNQAGKTLTLSNGRFDFKFNACACDG